MDVTEWQNRLEDNFTVGGVIGGNLLEILVLERAYGEYFAATFHGQSVLIDSFQSFYIETLHNALQWVADHGWPEACENYTPTLMQYVTIFRRFRACENLLLKGYPLDGYALLRDLKDRAILLAGIATHITTHASLHGYGGTKTPFTYQDWRKARKAAKVEEQRVLGKIIRTQSGLLLDIIKELEIWEQLFHQEVHGSMLSFAIEMKDWVSGTAPRSIGPTPKEAPMTMYMNRATEIAWLLLRLFPYLQAKEAAFDAEWHRRYRILDESFRYAQQDLSRLGKSIGDAFIKLVDEKFSFKQPFYYTESYNHSG